MYKLCNGTLVTRTVTVCNNGPQDATNVVTAFTPPAGIEIYAVTTTVGTYNTSSDEWTIPSIPYVESNPKCYTITLQFKITDATAAPFDIPYVTTSDQSELNPADNSGTITIERECPSVYIVNANNFSGSCTKDWSYCDDLLDDSSVGAAPASVNSGCLCGDLKYGSIPCNNCCKTEFELVPDSEVNLDSVTIDANTGLYRVIPTDPTLEWSFQYQLNCVNCGGCDDDAVNGPFGPATVTGPALFGCDDVLNCINIEVADTDSIDMTLDGTGTSGTPWSISADVILDPSGTNLLSISGSGLLATETLTTISYDVGTNQIAYVDENGATTTLSLSGGGAGGILQITDGVTAFGVEPGNPADNLITFEAGGDLSVLADGPTNKITYSFTETDTVITDNGNGTYTYTSEGGTTTVISAGGARYLEEFIELTTGNTVTWTQTVADLDTFNDEDIFVYRNGQLALTTDYAVSGNDVVFTEPFGFTDGDSEQVAGNGETVIIRVFGN